MAFPPAPEPPTALGRHRVLSPTCGLRVSPLSLGAMSIGDAWKDFMGSMDKKASFELLDAFYDAGGNFIDTANNYQNQQSEEWIGEWLTERNNRDELVIATKYTTMYDYGAKDRSNKWGNSYKSMFVSLEASLKKLKTHYVDILYLHWWDWTTSIEEVMQGLNNLVKSGKVLYLGVSDTPAWIVSSANRYARDHGLAQFVIYQGRWNVIQRDFERDILDLARHEGMALAPWNVLGGGKFQTKEQIEERKKQGEGLRSIMGSGEQSEQEEKISAALEKVRSEVGGKSITAVALAYVLQKQPYVFPIVGGRKVSHLMDNINALEIHLTDEQFQHLESVVPFDVGFPKDMFGGDPAANGGNLNFLAEQGGKIDFVTIAGAIGKVQKK
ncbi:Aldo/keto reductase [Cystobasidium minutum MCA 4210]|uniref:Aldo/keto reductase n=1 Tax=Cystobasidium minutum MCA 4210 TaxID=1397322 RepID=UPI0034CEE69B|eukprot:jgi/Rhomi1/170411/fgenesh1_kg.4_\